MKLVLAKLEDLNNIKEIYSKIVDNMYANDIKIWNEYYPNEVFESDINNGNLYLLCEGKIICGVFAIYEHNCEELDIKWSDRNAKAFLLNRVGVNVDYLRKGVGRKIISSAVDIAREKGAKYLRLFVSELNYPAINLYLKCDFKKLNGIHKEKIREDFFLNEYGFELLLE